MNSTKCFDEAGLVVVIHSSPGDSGIAVFGRSPLFKINNIKYVSRALPRGLLTVLERMVISCFFAATRASMTSRASSVEEGLAAPVT